MLRSLKLLCAVAIVLFNAFTWGQSSFPPKTPTSSSVITKSDTTITLATNISPPATKDASSQYKTYDLLPRLDCIFKKMERDYTIQVTPWRRAYLDVKSRRVDGFFTAIPMRHADIYATLSAPLVLENWYWFWRVDTEAPVTWHEGYKLGSILGGQQEAWLAEAGYGVDMSANNLSQLIKLLQSKRIDVLLADYEEFVQVAKKLGFKPDEFQSRFFRYVPLGVYFNHQFLQRNAGFLAQFNQHITTCGDSGFTLSVGEQERLTELLADKIERWKNLPGLQKLLEKRNLQTAGLSPTAILADDEQWKNAFIAGDITFAKHFIDSPMSALLEAEQNRTAGLITEMFVTDQRGLNAAISVMTSDYWQGDEEKFTQAFAKPRDSLFFDVIRYDESTRRFQAHISLPLYANAGEKPLGVMVIGVDIEQALSLAQ